MPRIRVLPESVIAKIAAGETIERPTSVLKELVENALDARATRIDVRVQERLDQHLEVSDDGIGMTEAEIDLALTRHATSKIAHEDDLFRLETLGFRGEALPAIATVSRVTITSSPGGGDGASEITLEGGVIAHRSRTNRTRGTTIVVRDLFYNVPVRRKFMKTERGELRAAMRLLSHMSLACPSVRFSFERVGSMSLIYDAAPDLRARALDVFGASMVNGMLEIAHENTEPSITGLIGLPEHSRATREFQVLIVNGRVVVSPLLQHAVRVGYGDLIPGDRHPVAILSMRFDPAFLDANVHPTKREVRFAREELAFEAVRSAVSGALRALAPTARPWAGTFDRPGNGVSQEWTPVPEANTDQLTLSVEPHTADAPGADPLVRERPARIEEPKLWQLHRRYVFAQVGSGLLVIDQHAAHERILYERALARLEKGGGPSQQLLLPKVLDLTPSELALVEELGDDLGRLGFEIEPFGGRSVIVRAVPADVFAVNLDHLLVDLLDEYGQAGRAVRDVRERLARAFSCRAAIKSGTLLGQEEMRALIDALFSTSTPHGDPHGRPTLIQTSLDELDRRFGRS